MSSELASFDRRKMLKTLTAGAALTLAVPSLGQAKSLGNSIELPSIPLRTSPESLASNEAFWAKIAKFYDKAKGIVNLEHGYWGKMARPVQDAFVKKTEMVNTQLSYYARKSYSDDEKLSVHKVAQALGVSDDEIVLTRNATESIHNLIRQYNDFSSKDTVLYTDTDYPSFKHTMEWLAKSRNVKAVQVVLPPRANQKQILDLYVEAFDKNPNLKLMLLTHVSNQHGLVLPVTKIAEAAKQRGIDVICDSAQSWGLLDYKITDLNVDWAGFNLHKWIGAPVGVGALYMKKGSLAKISPYPGELDPDNTNARTRVHTATSNFASILTIPAAIDFHQAIGPANKEARLRYLRSLWVSEAENMPHIEVLGGLDDASSTGMCSFRLVGKTTLEDAKSLQLRLETDFGIFTVVRVGLASGCCIRITPQVFVTADEIGQLVTAMKALA
ncbi:isopenicillin-N epimerase [Psychrosphaera saromensis]|uniref:Penicillin epimerase n=1 Tax=Psychrosphaera saromensis TaxID=716813 RepID=A0A2S7UXE8_9GAMM|nr:aminotransferase class V-fold PLP-dependent enzyme [Psychrosphaera saromensis]PQJ54172.1 penicillin epimerase [Psychrosphaera saromensis]GHB75385.1 isopenicillin-N epimerase [Psychrosphaera saromensis]GLQ12735.1 isopenicillin-N epimerase [Psychrosphaera saromensis]